METIGQMNFPKLEQQHFELMYMEDQLRSFEVPLPSLEYPFTPLMEYPPLNFNFIDNNEINFQTFENNNINNNFGEPDFALWSECPPLCDVAWNNSTFPCTFDNNPSPNPNPTTPYDFSSFELNDPFFLLNSSPNPIDCFNDQCSSMVVSDGTINIGSMQSNNYLENDNSYVINTDIFPNNDTINNYNNNNNNNNKVTKIESIRYEEIRKYFDMPISRAAKELNVGLTVLKKRCRELNIKRWPHRKIKSLNALISNVKEMGMMEVVQSLEEHKRKLKYVPGLDLTEDTKKLRQACFKANYKKRRAAQFLTH